MISAAIRGGAAYGVSIITGSELLALLQWPPYLHVLFGKAAGTAPRECLYRHANKPCQWI